MECECRCGEDLDGLGDSDLRGCGCAAHDQGTPAFGRGGEPDVLDVGDGSSTNSDFAKDIARRETLLRYTNRYYLPEYAKFLEPTKENIGRVRDEKLEAIRKMDEMLRELQVAKPNLKPAQAEEIQKRFEWMKEFAICARYLDESLWRYRYLHHLGEMLTTDKDQMKELDAAKAAIAEHSKVLRKYDPEGRLGSPVPLMTEIYEESQELIKLWGGLPN